MSGLNRFFDNRCILLTGVTGFVGKVLLEKILRCLANISKVYVLIREKPGSSIIERLKKEVIGSPCFERLRKIHGAGFQDFFNAKVVPIRCDLQRDDLGISLQEADLLRNSVSVVLNASSSLNLDHRFNDAIQNNVIGPLNIQNLAHQFRNLSCFVHVSTSYVNSNKVGWIEEELYSDEKRDDEATLHELRTMPPSILQKDEQKFLGSYPNTFTYSMAMCERLLAKRRGTTPLVFIRPSIIGCSISEPTPGWVDALSTAGSILLMTGIGLLRYLQANPQTVVDMIPLDYVVNTILVAAACYAEVPQLKIVQIGTSSLNPTTYSVCKRVTEKYFVENPPEKRIGKPNLNLVQDEKVLKLHRLSRRIPALAYYTLMQTVGNETKRKQSHRLVKQVQRAEVLSETLRAFTSKEWIFKTERIGELLTFVSSKDRENFELDVTHVDWDWFLKLYCYGLKRYVLKEQANIPSHVVNTDLLSKYPDSYFSDIIWSLGRGKYTKEKPSSEYKAMVLNTPRVQAAIKEIIVSRVKKIAANHPTPVRAQANITSYVNKSAEDICDMMFSDYKMPMLRVFAWFLHKLFKQIYEKVVVDEAFMARLAEYDESKQGPMLLIPTHRSYTDFLIVSYIFFAFKIKCPYIAAAEDFLSIIMVNHLLRSSGAFFIRRSRIEFQELYRVILYEYLQCLLVENNHLEFFIEGTRSRSGKLLPPKFGMLTIATDTYFDGKLPNMHILPLSINYERVLEGETFPLELLGEAKIKESLMRIVRAAKIINMNFGKIFINFAEPISLKDYSETWQRDSKKDPMKDIRARKELVRKLGNEVVCQLADKLVIMSTAMLAAVLLMHRKGVGEELLVKKVDWLAKEIIARGAMIGGGIGDSGAMLVRSAMNHLDGIVNRQKDVFKLSFSPKVDYKNILLLSYYRNTMLHIFILESIVGCAIAAFGQQIAWQEGMSCVRLWEEVQFLYLLLKPEFIIAKQLTSIEDMKALLRFMESRGTVILSGDLVKVNQNGGENALSFLCYLIWPFIDCYWVTIAFLFSLKESGQNFTEQKLFQNIQWFAESMYEERVIDNYESCSLDTIKHAYKTYLVWGLISIETNEEPQLDETLAPSNEKVLRLKMPEEQIKAIEEHISKFQKNSFAKSVNSPIELARKSMVVDFPFMAKL